MSIVHRRISGFVAVVCLGLLTACANPTPTFDQNVGQSLTALRAQQTLNPNAPTANAKRIPEGMDGRAARETLERYQRSFQQPERQSEGSLIGGAERR